MTRATDGEIFLAMFRRGYSIEAIAELQNTIDEWALHETRDGVEEEIRKAINEAAKHKRRTK